MVSRAPHLSPKNPKILKGTAGNILSTRGGHPLAAPRICAGLGASAGSLGCAVVLGDVHMHGLKEAGVPPDLCLQYFA